MLRSSFTASVQLSSANNDEISCY